ncbi:MAG: DUF1573 domain-containing protein [Fuerstiella sp.]|nr:DUF1573 domain-containing protein [Fuerstiella sp.]
MKILLSAIVVCVPGTLLISGCADEDALGPHTETAHDHANDGSTNHDDSTSTNSALVPAKEGPWPTVVADEDTFNFGSMAVGGEQEHAFVIRNEGQGDLNLVAGEPTCKCTAFELSRETVKPGEEGTLLVRWIGKFKDDAFQHGGSVYTNDPAKSEIKFSVKGIVDTDFELLPTSLWRVGEVSKESGGTMQAFVGSRIHKEFEITAIDCESQYVSTVVTRASQETLTKVDAISGYTIDVMVSSDMPPGLLEEELELKLDRTDSPFRVTITAKKDGPIRILPTPGVALDRTVNGLKLGQFPTNKGRRAELTLLVDTSGMSEPFAATSVESSPSFVKAKLVAAGDLPGGRSRHKLIIEIPPGIARMERDRATPGLIDMQTNHPSGQAIKLKLSFKAF